VQKIFQIAIDGPVGAGKSTVARQVAERLGILYIDTGAMYRAVGLYVKRKKVSWVNEIKVGALLPEIEVEIKRLKNGEREGGVMVLLNGEDVSLAIRRAEIGEGASMVSQYGKVRDKLVALQREMAKGQSVVMEGRDIGTRVLPEAQLKIYMDADVNERAKRKQRQMREKGEMITWKEAKTDVETRDGREMSRKIDPLRPTRDAWILDTTNLTIEQVVERIVAKVSEL